ncbi:MAG: hypothetical protein KAR07_11220 [Spirochaetes bacterium]|nr:hypothetical protein [Spirochaetota bacterium]
MKDLNIDSGSAILFKTDNSINGEFFNGKFTKDYCCLDESAAEKCLEMNPVLIGIDAPSIESYESVSYDVHKKLLSHGILILEGINLSTVTPGEYTLMCMPLKLDKAEASPVRAILFR